MSVSKLAELQRIRQYHEDKESGDRLKYERSLVRTLLKRLSISPIDLSMRRAYDCACEGEADTFPWFDSTFPDFPVYFSCQELRNPDFSDFFRPNSRDNTLWVPWHEVAGSVRVGKSIGCVFRPTQLTKLGPMVMHNYIGGHNDDGFVFMRSTVSGSEVTLEPLDSLLERVRLRWKFR